jgi:hypothetical protein
LTFSGSAATEYISKFTVPFMYQVSANTCTYPQCHLPLPLVILLINYLRILCLMLLDYIWTQSIILSFYYLSIKYLTVLYIINYHSSFTPLHTKYLYHKLSLFYSICMDKYLLKWICTNIEC